MKSQPQTTLKLIDKVTPPATTVLQKAYDTVMKDIKTAKKNKKTKAQVLDKGFTTATAVMTKALIEQFCKKLYDKVTKLEWDCFKTHTKDLINFGNYNCSTWQKKK
ncbi:unnamed protein product [Strongylus vulgaris]|uniref:Uncharacterized protein n=1 Tax=Strongylus vulgaris TaxID=40348 RepID=A0A3P7J3N2_STRVU|nr:unnamed protein product [Strongylus vulgaris]